MRELPRHISKDLRKEILDLLMSRYGKKEIEDEVGYKISTLKRGSDKAIAILLSTYSGNDELRNLIWRRYTEFGYALKNLGISAPENRNLMERLDDESKDILWHLYQKGHANIVELSEAVCASHYEVLSRLKDVIIPESRRTIGKPIVKFEESKIDWMSGEKVLFSWWIMDGDMPVVRRYNVELFNEMDKITIIAELPGTRFPDQIDVSARYNNGILEVIIKKGQDEVGIVEGYDTNDNCREKSL